MLKRIVDLGISVLVGAGDQLRQLTSRLFRQKPQSTCMVLAYHAVSSKERPLFARQMDLLQSMATPIRADVNSLPNDGKRYVAMTFDDGLDNILDNALPELKQRRIPATLFIVSELLGRTRDWEHYGGDDTRHERVMSRDQLVEVASDPDLICVGSHTSTHPMLPKLAPKDMERELLGSRVKLEEMLSRRVTTFSFPYGAFSKEAIDACRDAGYERVFTALPIRAISTAGEFVSGRVGVTPNDWDIEFRLKVKGAYRWLPIAYELKRNLRSLVKGRSGRTVLQAKRNEVA
jgi:peptidoglycan/xylan/chitin deacetylase (PgdA/CDA1 family)